MVLQLHCYECILCFSPCSFLTKLFMASSALLRVFLVLLLVDSSFMLGRTPDPDTSSPKNKMDGLQLSYSYRCQLLT